MEAAHTITWWGSLDPYSFGCRFNEDRIFDLPNPREADRLLLLSLVVPPGDQHVKYVGSLETRDQKAIAYTAFTAYTHEWRHWYDASSTPFGIIRTGQLASFFATISQLDDEVRSLPKLFTPLYWWVRKPDAVRQAYPEIPRPSERISSVVEAAFRVLRKADHQLSATYEVDGVQVSTAMILESLAMLTQEAAADRAFGPESAAEIRGLVARSPSGPQYYQCCDLLAARGCKGRSEQIAVLETTLFVNYGVYGSEASLSPPMLFGHLANSGKIGDGPISGEVLDELLIGFHGFDRYRSLSMSYEVASKTYERMLASALEGLPGAEIRSAIASSLRFASLFCSATRFPERIGGAVPAGVTLPDANPYSLRAPFVVEGFPGRIEPVSNPQIIETLVGADLASGQVAEALGSTLSGVTPVDPSRVAEPHRLSVVWAPKADGASSPPHFGVLKVYRELLYWRVALFGKQSISRFTYSFGVEPEAAAKGQVIL